MRKYDEYFGKAKEKAQGILQDARAGKEIRKGIADFEALPEFEGSIVYTMELEAMISDLKSLSLIINDNRLDYNSVVEEILKVMEKVRPESDHQTESETQLSSEQQAIEKIKTIAYSACSGALEALKAAVNENKGEE